MEIIKQAIVKSEELHNQLWSKVVTLTENSNYSGITTLFHQVFERSVRPAHKTSKCRLAQPNTY